jgi:hypothetical protein
MTVPKSLLKNFSGLSLPKNSLGSRWLIRPALWGSIGLHILLLLLPIPERQPIESAETQVKLTPQPSPSPSPTAKPSPQPVPQPVARPLRPSPLAQTPAQIPVQPPVKPPVKLPVKPPQQRPVPSAAQRPTPPTPQSPAAKPRQTAVPSPSSPQPSPAPVSTPTPPVVPALAIPFADVPLLAGAQTGCFGLGTCRQIMDGTPFREAGQTLEQQFQAQGYTVKLRADLEDTGRKVYELNKGKETRYLNVLSADVGNMVYLVTPQPVSLSELQGSEPLKAQLEAILNGIPATTANVNQFFQPDAFFANATARPETGGRLRLVAGQSPDQMLQTLTPQLQAQGFSLTAAGGYGSGLLYEVTQAAYTGYLSLVPAADQSGTIVVLWTNVPN